LGGGQRPLGAGRRCEGAPARRAGAPIPLFTLRKPWPQNGIIFFTEGKATFRKSLEQLYLFWIIAKVAGDTYSLAIPEPWQPCQ